ncbi:MAG: glycosyltransferase [Roseiflexus sp.]
MRRTITLLVSGTLGDVRPLVALGVGLRNAGYVVQMATHARYAPLVQAHGLRWRCVEGNPSDLLRFDNAALTLDRGALRGAIATLRYIRRAQAVYARMIDSATVACRDSDALIVSLASCWGQLIATAFGLPCIWTPLQPITPTARFPSPMLPVPHRLAHLSYSIVELATWLPWRAVLRRWRSGAPGPRRALLDPFALARQSRVPFIYGFSPYVIPPPADWSPHHTVAGYWFLDDPDERLLPEIISFLANGDPPIAIGFGSMGERQPHNDAVLMIKALTLARRRGILIGAPAAARMVNGRRDLLVAPYVPHHLLFPHVAVAMHHGGAGATAASLRAGVPTVTIPVGIDQPFWGRRVAALGAGPPPLMRRHATPNLLAATIIAATDDAIRVRAAALGRLIRAEQGVTRAVETIRACLGW